MKFIKLSEKLKEITAVSISPNKKFLAVCETQRDDRAAYVSFYDLKTDYYR
jgi:hypothetical protein